jgi:hypothetical protein
VYFEWKELILQLMLVINFILCSFVDALNFPKSIAYITLVKPSSQSVLGTHTQLKIAST